MQRYFFDLSNGDDFTRDDDGRELPSRTAISREIAKILLEVAQDEIVNLDYVRASVTVRDNAGRTVSRSSLIMNNEWLG